MRPTKEVLRARCKRPLHLAKFLNLSGLELVRIKHLEQCAVLHWLIASNNKLQSDEGLENLKQLWYLDLSDNQITYLNCLSRYLALGTVILTNNNIKWLDLEKIRHAHFLCISLHGNPCLDSDPYYRIHAIDCLPLIWELDGRLVTVTERLHVEQFFIDEEFSQHPVRHKLGKSFQSSFIKNIGTEGIVSKECKYIYSKFPMSETHTKHTDERRLRYLTHMVQKNILRWNKELDRSDHARPLVTSNFLDKLLEQRHKDVEGCNMVMLLLVISLEFQLPTVLVRSVLYTVGLAMIGSAFTMPLFLLPPFHRARVVCILLNAAKVDRDNNVEHSGGLYPELFVCLYYTVAQLTRISQTSQEHMHKLKPISLNSDYTSLMAGEVVSLMLQVPKYFSYLLSDTGVINMTESATGSMDVIFQAQERIEEAEDIFNNIPMRQAHRVASDLILTAIQKRLERINIKMTDIPVGDRYLALSDSRPIKPLHSVIWASKFLTKGERIPRLDPPILNPVREAMKPKPQQPKIGDQVLLGPQVVGDIYMLLDGGVGMVKIDAVPTANGAVESKLKSSEPHYLFVDMKALCYARDIAKWRPIKTSGDKFTISSTNSCQQASMAHINKSYDEYVEPLQAPWIQMSKNGAEKQVKNESKRQSLSGRMDKSNSHNASVASSWIKGLKENIHRINDKVEEGKNANFNKIPPSPTSPETLTLQESSHNQFGPVNSDEESRPSSQNSLREFHEFERVPFLSRSNSPVLEATQMDHDDIMPSDTSDSKGTEFRSEAALSSSVTELGKVTSYVHTPALVESDLDLPMVQGFHQSLVGHSIQSDKDENDYCNNSCSAVESEQVPQPRGTTENNGPSINVENAFLTDVADQSESFSSHNQLPSQEVLDVSSTHENRKNLRKTGDERVCQPKILQPSLAVRLRVGNQKMPAGPPQSHSGISCCEMITCSPCDVLTGTSARFADNGVFKTDFQQQREKAWKQKLQHKNKPSSVTSHLPMPNSQHLDFQTSSAHCFKARNPSLRITPTEKWLGGGRDIFCETIRLRSKSGHIPGWKDGLPDSMMKRKVKSAAGSSFMNSMSRETLYCLSMTSCSECHSIDAAPSATEILDLADVLQISDDFIHQPRCPPLSSPISEEDRDPLPVLVSDISNSSGLFIKGFHLSRRCAGLIYEDDIGELGLTGQSM